MFEEYDQKIARILTYLHKTLQDSRYSEIINICNLLLYLIPSIDTVKIDIMCEYYIALWKLRKRFEAIEKLKPTSNTSIFTILLRPDDQLEKIRSMLNEDLAEAAKIKSDQNRSSVQEGLKAINEYLMTYKYLPANGLACFYASRVTYNGKESKLKLYFEPPRPIATFVYKCSANFDTSPLHSLMENKFAVGHIVIDSCGALFATVRGNSKTIHHKMSTDFSNKFYKGGQSPPRFAKIREESQKIYIKSVCEKASYTFIVENMPNISSLVLAGQSNLIKELKISSYLDCRLRAIQPECLVLTTDYGGELGLKEAIKKSRRVIGDSRLGFEINVISVFMDLLRQGKDNLIAYGVGEESDALK